MCHLLVKYAISAGVKAGSAFAAVLVTVLVSRVMPQDEAGLFLLFLTICSVLSTLCQFGLDIPVLRRLSSTRDLIFVNDVLFRALLWVSLGASVIVFFGLVAGGLILNGFLYDERLGPVLIVGLPSVLFLSLSLIYSKAYQSRGWIASSYLYETLGVNLVLVVTLSVALLLNRSIASSASNLAVVYALASFVVFIVAAYVWWWNFGRFHMLTLSDRAMFKAGREVFAATCMALLVNWSGILVASVFVLPERIAELAAAQRVSMLVAFILVVANMVVAPKFARLWVTDQLGLLERLVKITSRVMIFVASVVLFSVFVFAEDIMGLFGAGFKDSSALLVILSIGQFVNVATGSVGMLLNMSGHERDFRRVTSFSGPLAFLLSVVGAAYWGIFGAAIATAVSLGVQNVLALFMVRKRLGFWTV
ncbi:polysaccharide biosynthesis C-terminal domain-containing protein [Granulosicoccaceae sp. 1_MG-2023]|nr:polysaccharide biosynthesis C-terminal domain-containing protein [Granulosicoccaceae sp. 1_MG-2023]